MHWKDEFTSLATPMQIIIPSISIAYLLKLCFILLLFSKYDEHYYPLADVRLQNFVQIQLIKDC